MSFWRFYFAVILALFLSACPRAGQRPGSVAPLIPDSQNTNTQSGPSTPQGPSDGGGGNTCKKKMIEAYKVDISTQKEYYDYVLLKLKKVSPRFKSDEKMIPSIWDSLFKSWYLIDCQLQNLAEVKTGLYMDTEQTARQSNQEVYIDVSKYNEMSIQDKAYLILHEMVMGYYMMKYMTIEQICNQTATCTKEDLIRSKWKIFQPETYKDLDQDDHARIRNVTQWIWRGTDNNPDSFMNLLQANNFDKRFDPFHFDIRKKDSISAELATEMFKKYKAKGNFPSHCMFDRKSGKSLSGCRVEMNFDIQPHPQDPNLKRYFLDLKIIREADGKIFQKQFHSIFKEGNPDFIIRQMGEESSLSTGYLYFENKDVADDPSYWKEGEKGYSLRVLLDLSNPSKPTIHQIIYHVEEIYQVVKGEGDKPLLKMMLSESDSEVVFIEDELDFNPWSIIPNETTFQTR